MKTLFAYLEGRIFNKFITLQQTTKEEQILTEAMNQKFFETAMQKS